MAEDTDPTAVVMNCRASPSCEGRRATVVFKKTQPITAGGGTTYRYRCVTCNGVWHLTR